MPLVFKHHVPATDLIPPSSASPASTGSRSTPSAQAGRNWGYGAALPAQDNIILDLFGLTAILDFDPELSVATLEPGVTQAQLAEFIDQGQ